MSVTRDARILFSNRTQYDAFLRALNSVSSETVRVIQESPVGSNPSPGDIGALSIALRLAEFSTEQAKVEARTNLDLQNIDGGTFT